MEWNMEDIEEFYETLLSIFQEIDNFANEYRHIFISLREAFDVCHAMVNKQNNLSDRLDEFRTIWQEKWDQNLDPESERAVDLGAVNQDAEDILEIKKTFEDETKELFHQLTELLENLQVQVDRLHWAQATSTFVEQLGDSDPVEFENRCHDFGSRVADLNRQWDEKDLNPRVGQCLEILRAI